MTCLEFLNKKNPAAAEDYLSQLCNNFNETAIPKVCSNQWADALICHYLKLAKQQDITVNMDLHLPEDIGIDPQDLCVILGNCLENAIEACVRLPEKQLRWIDIKTTISKGHLNIDIANSFDGLVQRKGDRFGSTKNGSDHGIGLVSVRALTAKYQGHCFISCEEQWFKVAISLRLPESA